MSLEKQAKTDKEQMGKKQLGKAEKQEKMDKEQMGKKQLGKAEKQEKPSGSFVHLHVHTHYSLLKSSCTVSGVVEQCEKFKQPAVAITDYGNMFGVLDLYFKAKEGGVKPILGLEVYLSSGSRFEKKPHSLFMGRPNSFSLMQNPSLILLAQNLEGYRNLCKISTIAYQEGFYYVPRVDYETLKKYNNSLIALTGGFNGEVPLMFLKKGPEPALDSIKKLKNIYQNQLYLQLNRTGVKGEEDINSFLMEASKKMGLSVTAGNDVHYLQKADSTAQDVLYCIGANRTLRDSERFKLPSDQFYFKSSEEMRGLFKDLPEVCDRTLEIADLCNVEFKLKDEDRAIYHLPKLPQDIRNPKKELRELSFKGLEKRAKGFADKEKSLVEYETRLKEELKIINDMGFADYFLIVYDFVHWAKNEDIPVGPGRGSGAGSLTAYCLEITDLDPMPYHLLFERFLNPKRISLPDFDIDFCQENRNRVIDYVSKKYGKDYVAQVMTYGRLQARAAIRDVGRVLGMSYMEVDQVAKLIPEKLGITLEEALKDNQRLNELMEADPQIETLLNLARKIEGLIRHVSIHAAGVIIADEPIIHFAPLYRGEGGENIIQCDLNHSKKIGLVKFDFLGLKTLTQVRTAFEMIKRNRERDLALQDISLENEGIYEIMCKGDTQGVFQFEGEGITKLIIKSQPSCFEDIVAINALFRPGPMDMIQSYLDRKKGEINVEYPFADLEPVLKETYGVIVYQEQVLFIASKIAGYSYGEADVLRRAMGEKNPSVMKKQKARFLEGAKKNGYNLKKSEKLFDLVAEFAKYGFNKSHAAAYCVLAAQTAWLKKYYPVEFFASLLSIEINNTDKIVRYVRDADKHGIKPLPPHVNYSEYFFTPVKDQIYFSLGAIKGVGRSAVEHIVEVRKSLKEKKFTHVQDFFEKTDSKKINKKCMEALIKAGAFDNMGLNRSEILFNYERFLEQVEKKKEETLSGQFNLFSNGEKKEQAYTYIKQPEWDSSLRLQYEKSVIGFYLSGHPMDYLRPFTKVCGCKSIASLRQREGGKREGEKNNKKMVSVWGVLSELREITTRKGVPMAFARLEDGTGVLEVVFFSDVYLRFEKIIRSTQEPLVIKGTLGQEENNRFKILVKEVEPAHSLLNQKSQRVILQLDEKPQSTLLELKQTLNEHEGSVPLYFNVKLPHSSKPVCLKPNVLKGVALSSQFLERVQKTIGGPHKMQID